MLADEILAASGSFPDRIYHGAFTALGIAIRGAKRFDLTPGVIVTANTVSGSSISAQFRALPLCRLPFEYVWMEWPGADPVYASFREDNATELAPPPQRMGVLVHTDASRQAGSMTFAWLHRQAGLNACPLACFFDWRENAPEVMDVARDLFRQSGASEEELRRHIIEQSRTLPQGKRSSDDDLLDHRSRFGLQLSPAFYGWSRAVMQQQGSLPGPGTPAWEMWARDIRGEPGQVRSIIMLLNTRNLLHHEELAAPERLNNQRLKSGKLPLLGRTIIRIRLSHGLQARAGLGGQREAARLHAVRGHFKIRTSGVYWWSDHFRGDAVRGVLHSSYKLEA